MKDPHDPKTKRTRAEKREAVRAHNEAFDREQAQRKRAFEAVYGMRQLSGPRLAADLEGALPALEVSLAEIEEGRQVSQATLNLEIAAPNPTSTEVAPTRTGGAPRRGTLPFALLLAALAGGDR